MELVDEVVRDLLGPRHGSYEKIMENPLNEYITGVLQPAGTVAGHHTDTEMEMEVQGSITSGEEDTDEAMELPPVVFSPALDPKSRPSVMGLSFVVEDVTPLSLELCVTWGRYFREEEENGQGENKTVWKRKPRYWIGSVQVTGSKTFYLVPDESGFATALSSANGNGSAEVSVHIRVTDNPRGTGKRIYIHLVNRIDSDQDQQRSFIPVESFIFQPSIRVLLGKNVHLLPIRSTREDATERELDFLYRRRAVYARGHLCSAMWREIDPERPFGEGEKKSLTWFDSEVVPPGQRDRFLAPDVRTEFLPVYATQAPSWEWDDSFGPPPELDPETLSSSCRREKLLPMLEPLVKGYEKWLEERKKEAVNLQGQEKEVAGNLLREAEDTLRKMKRGLDLLRNDPDARLAFTFANRAMWLQAKWKKRSLKWRPFQLGFLISVIESVANPKSPDRGVCDLLWVPTGGGKTEAYLALIAFTLAYRRRRALREGRGHLAGNGTAVISRYTLRLLTLQQFRRALSTITACEFLRVEGTGKGKIGWRPGDCDDASDFIWGTTRFSIGLWVGGGLTPNKLGESWVKGKGKVLGALNILKGEVGRGIQEGEPAQVIRCPACDALLAIPRSGLSPGNHRIHLVLSQSLPEVRNQLKNLGKIPGSSRFSTHLSSLPSGGTVLSLDISLEKPLKVEDFNSWWKGVSNRSGLKIESLSAARPGYFGRTKKASDDKSFFDFEIWCPNPECPLGENLWFESVPSDDSSFYKGQKNVRGSGGYFMASAPGPEGKITVNLPESAGYFRRVISPWRADKETLHIASRVPVPALTVDEQLYASPPSLVIATVDKFARLSYEPKAGNLFGNVNYYHPWNGYSFADSNNTYKMGVRVVPPDPPDLILQDELHLVEGPLGSMMGLYEMAVDCLASRNGTPVKYVASTATIREADSQVQAVFNRKLSVFPPRGLDVDDRFFLRTREPHPFDESRPGQLFLGLAAPGSGPLKPLYRLWAILLQAAGERENDPDYDYFRTLTGYFNAIRELAGVRAMTRQDIKLHLNTLARYRGTEPRQLDEEKVVELSSRVDSTDLPALLEDLERSGPAAPDALLATSMFGTGVDVSRLSLMVVHGQPKTTSSYIQAAGRVGRNRAALVVTFYRVTRPRDLSHYEFFSGYHRQMYRHVEPVTVMPFSPGALDVSAGPVAVALLRNGWNTDLEWRENARYIAADDGWKEAEFLLYSIFKERSQTQPELRRPDPESVISRVQDGLDRWRSIAQSNDGLRYEEYGSPVNPVVLGTPAHVHAGLAVFENAPQSLREVEETISIQI